MFYGGIIMTREGRLARDKFGYGMPVDAPLFAKPPIYYRYAETVSVTYETDAEAVLDLLPEGLTLLEPATAVLIFAKYPFSTLGAYEETILCIPCIWNNEIKVYIPHIFVNNDIPQIAGREVWGYPKKIAKITINKEYDIIMGQMERPEGNLICTAGIRPETHAEEGQNDIGILSLRIIPSPEEGAQPSVAELIEVPQNIEVLESWSGPGWAKFHSNSVLDPLHKLTVKNVLSANYRIYHSILEYGKIIKKYI
jgi:acetoacetate decarboxylase